MGCKDFHDQAKSGRLRLDFKVVLQVIEANPAENKTLYIATNIAHSPSTVTYNHTLYEGDLKSSYDDFITADDDFWSIESKHCNTDGNVYGLQGDNVEK